MDLLPRQIHKALAPGPAAPGGRRLASGQPSPSLNLRCSATAAKAARLVNRSPVFFEKSN
jgi:hypothetical protein